MNNEIKSEFLILDFDCDAEEVTKKMGIEPTHVVLKGDLRFEDPEGIRPPILNDRNIWILRFNIPTDLSFEDHLDQLLSQLKPYTRNIAQLMEKYAGEISIYGYSKDATRNAFNIGREPIDQLARFKVDLDVDIYPL